MFKDIVINVRGPLCSCEENRITPNLNSDASGRLSVRFTCARCNVTLTVPTAAVTVRLHFDLLYPNEQKEVERLERVRVAEAIAKGEDPHAATATKEGDPVVRWSL